MKVYFHASGKDHSDSANGVERVQGGGMTGKRNRVLVLSLAHNIQKWRPRPKPERRTRENNEFRLLAIELANGNALAVLVDVTKVADADGLSNVGAGGHSELHGLLDVVAIPVPLVQERSEGAVAGADGRDKLDVELTLGIPDVLAVGEVSVTAATTGEQHVLDAGS